MQKKEFKKSAEATQRTILYILKNKNKNKLGK
jgi:hypothetical protein